MNDLRIALAVTTSPVGRIRENLDRISTWTVSAAKKGAGLICFPEMNITGYSSRMDIRNAAQPIPGPASEHVSALAVRENIIILAGLAETDSRGRCFASQLVATPDGGVGVYRKIHVAPPEKKALSGGSSVPLFHCRGVKFGIQLCYDAHFPELSTHMAVKGADVVFLPHASPRGTSEEKLASWLRHLTARAFDNGIFIAAVNQTGDNGLGLAFPGVAVVIGPSGDVLYRHTNRKETLLMADLNSEDLSRVRRHPMRYFLPNRRPGMYTL